MVHRGTKTQSRKQVCYTPLPTGEGLGERLLLFGGGVEGEASLSA